MNVLIAIQRTAVCLMVMLSAAPIYASFPLSDLSLYYINYRDPLLVGSLSYDTPSLPVVRVNGGGVEPPPRTNVSTGQSFNSIHRLVGTWSRPSPGEASWDQKTRLTLYPTWWEPCVSGGVGFDRTLLAGQSLDSEVSNSSWYGGPCDTLIVGAYFGFATAPPPDFRVASEYSVGALKRRSALDGGQYDASPMEVKRNGVAWYTHFWGYRLGLVANESNFVDADRGKLPAGWPIFPSSRNNFELATLPPPWVEDDVVEYVNRADFPAQPGGQYFYAVLATDKTLLDSLPVWQRTGKGFKSGGYVSACRFYGGKNGGPNTHFYSADDKECAALKAIPQLSYEGQTFAINVPLPGAAVDGVRPCPVDSKALYRAYNNASTSNGRFVSNHRYLTEKTDVATVVAQGWVDEGQVMCVPL